MLGEALHDLGEAEFPNFTDHVMLHAMHATWGLAPNEAGQQQALPPAPDVNDGQDADGDLAPEFLDALREAARADEFGSAGVVASGGGEEQHAADPAQADETFALADEVGSAGAVASGGGEEQHAADPAQADETFPLTQELASEIPTAEPSPERPQSQLPASPLPVPADSQVFAPAAAPGDIPPTQILESDDEEPTQEAPTQALEATQVEDIPPTMIEQYEDAEDAGTALSPDLEQRDAWAVEVLTQAHPSSLPLTGENAADEEAQTASGQVKCVLR